MRNLKRTLLLIFCMSFFVVISQENSTSEKIPKSDFKGVRETIEEQKGIKNERLSTQNFVTSSNSLKWSGVNNSSGKIYRTGITGIGLSNPPNDTQLYVKTGLKVGIVAEVNHSTDFQFGILSAVNRVKTKALSVLLKNSNGSYTDTFAVMGDGTVRATEVRVKVPVFPDYVFEKNYKLPTLEEVEAYINKHGHLEGIPSAKEVEENEGISLGEMNVKLLEKIEELTLYLIEQNKIILELNNRVSEFKN